MRLHEYMSKRTEEIRRKIEEKLKGVEQVFPATIKEVNEDEFTCTVVFDDELEYTDVRLRAVIDEELKGFCFIPVVDSKVQIGRIGNSDQLFVALFSEIDKVIFTSNNLAVTIDADKLEVKQGENDEVQIYIDDEKIEATIDQVNLLANASKVKIDVKNIGIELTENEITLNGGQKGSWLTDINALVGKINALENDLNNLKTVLTTWVPVPMDGGAVLKALVTAWGTQMIMPITTANDLKDSKVKH